MPAPAPAAPTSRESHQIQLRERSSLQKPQRFTHDINAATVVVPVPKTFKEAVSGPNSAEWTRAIEEELAAQRCHNTWEIIARDKHRKPIDSKWVFKLIRDSNGNIKRFKARLCARGFMQKEGIDYTDTYAPVVRYDSIRILLSLVAL